MNIVVSHNLIVPKYMINVNRKGSKNPKARAWVGGARKRISPKNFGGEAQAGGQKGRGLGGIQNRRHFVPTNIFASEPDFDFWRGTIYEVITFF